MFRTADGEDADPLASADTPATFPDRLASVDGAVTLYNVDLPAVGGYHFTLSVNDVPVATRRLTVNPIAGPEDR